MINFLVLIVLFFSHPAGGDGYNPFTGQIICHDRASCLHEVGHFADHRAGWISQGEDWRRAVDIYRYMTWQYPDQRDTLSEEIHLFPGFGTARIEDNNPLHSSFLTGWGGYTELYADILRMADGQSDLVPASLRDFYNWDLISERMEDRPWRVN